ncbi:MAG: hydroxyisourate hydrolase [Chitinophagaceae bacterium]|nr:hydroxyisourate hydrolase [Chitinophagaceae bacterium]
MSQLTTHILDTTAGKPAAGVSVVLLQEKQGQWKEMATGITNADGRIPDLLKKETVLEQGTYKMRFETSAYFEKNKIRTFYPYVEIVFGITSAEHYHVPLLLNPFGYSTYRGS